MNQTQNNITVNTPVSKMSDDLDAILIQIQNDFDEDITYFNDEIRFFKNRSDTDTFDEKQRVANIIFNDRQSSAAYLSKKYLRDKLDNFASSEAVSKIRKEVEKQIDELRNP
jgi:hypothetical protein